MILLHMTQRNRITSIMIVSLDMVKPIKGLFFVQDQPTYQNKEHHT